MNAQRRRIAARLNAMALEQLRDVAARQAEQIEQLQSEIEQFRSDLSFADSCAEMWQRTAEIFQEGGTPGLTVSGEVVAVVN